MPSFFSRYSTPFVTGLFLVSLISGIALFFHWQSGLFKSMHEWLSMVLIVPFVLHVWKNWRPFLAYFRRAPMMIALVLSLVAGSTFAWVSMSGTAGGPPQFAIAEKVINAPIASVAPLLGETPDGLKTRLIAAGFGAAEEGLALKEIAAKSGKDNRAMLSFLVKPAQ